MAREQAFAASAVRRRSWAFCASTSRADITSLGLTVVVRSVEAVPHYACFSSMRGLAKPAS